MTQEQNETAKDIAQGLKHSAEVRGKFIQLALDTFPDAKKGDHWRRPCQDAAAHQGRGKQAGREPPRQLARELDEPRAHQGV